MSTIPPSPIRSVEALRQYLDTGATPKYLFFWGHTAQPGRPIGKEVFSQWYPAPFTLDGNSYVTSEQYMMAEKARFFGDEATRAAILASDHPNQAKKLGRLVQNFDEARWETARFATVVRGNKAKFSQHPLLQEYLLASGTRVLAEASPVDAIWGIGLVQDHPNASNPAKWPGLNLLGFALMEVREWLSQSIDPAT